MITRKLLVLLVCLTTGCVHSTQSTPYSADDELFALVVEELLADSTWGELRVDPRPLKPDPAILMLHTGLDEAAPRSLTAPGGPLLSGDSTMVKERQRILAAKRVPAYDAFKYHLCSGALAPRPPEAVNVNDEQCPSTEFRSAIIAMPRRGGVFVPGRFDERAADEGDVWSVRVITQDLGPRGSVGGAFDYVFKRDGSWRLVKEELLYIVE